MHMRHIIYSVHRQYSVYIDRFQTPHSLAECFPLVPCLLLQDFMSEWFGGEAEGGTQNVVQGFGGMMTPGEQQV